MGEASVEERVISHHALETVGEKKVAVAYDGHRVPDRVAHPSNADRRVYLRTKRFFDVVIAAFLLLLVGMLMPVIAIAIKLDSRGPVFFTQQRIRGRRQDKGATWAIEPFKLYKFRTMAADAGSALHQEYITAYITGDKDRLASLRPERKQRDSFRPGNDPRVTRVGGILRKFSLDELPQLWNVLRGDMSLVGPRPPLAYEVALYEPSDLQRLATPGGLTGWAQVKGRCAIKFDELIGLDLEYVARQSIWFDLKVLFRTIPVVLSTKGAD
jgi:lipopolysaccharide/colanic/teichoic acid biosynthesis glycosyltransferase